MRILSRLECGWWLDAIVVNEELKKFQEIHGNGGRTACQAAVAVAVLKNETAMGVKFGQADATGDDVIVADDGPEGVRHCPLARHAHD
jgi:phosphoserine aminotransferase